LLDFSLSEDQRQILDTVRRVRKDVIEPNAMRWLDGTFPYENMEKLAEVGILGMTVPVEYGGMGANVLDTVLVLEEISKGCYVTAMAVLGEVGVQCRIIATYAPEELKQKWLPAIAEGKFILAICMTEPNVGTDLGNMTTNASVENDRVVINGTKTLISRVDESDVYIVFTRVNGVPGSKGIGCVLVERKTPGISTTGTFHTMGGELLAELQFDNVEVPLENLVLHENSLRTLMNAFNTQRCLNPSICLGLAESSFEHSVRYLRDRNAFGHPIGDFQGLRWKGADMLIQIEAARGLLYRAAASADPFPDPTLAAMAKVFVNEMAIEVCSQAVQIHGGYGFLDEFAVSRNFRGARFGALGGGTTETLRNLVGRHIVERMDIESGISGLGFY
jgi:alkylation response protein AidB-like acyl-CoA dehydrogenase